MSPDHRLIITVSVSGELAQAFKNYLLHSYKELSAYSAKVCPHRNILLTAANF